MQYSMDAGQRHPRSSASIFKEACRSDHLAEIHRPGEIGSLECWLAEGLGRADGLFQRHIRFQPVREIRLCPDQDIALDEAD